MMTDLMTGFPPSPQGQVTLANWRTAPYNRWAFQHVREIVPSADIANEPSNVRPLPPATIDADGLRIPDPTGPMLTLDEFLRRAGTDALVALREGRIVIERYANGMGPRTPHILMSVSKSLLGLLTGSLVAQDKIDPEALVTTVVPELIGTACEGASIQHLLDMRTGVAFDEDYMATSGPIVEYRKSTNWNPLGHGDSPSDLRAFYQSLRASDGHHGGRFHYISPNTDLLGWIIERATGQRFADLMSHYLWKPMGAESSAYITVDRLGAPRCAGGICTTIRDLALSDSFSRLTALAKARRSSRPPGSTTSSETAAKMPGRRVFLRPASQGAGCTTATSGTSTWMKRPCYSGWVSMDNTCLSIGGTRSWSPSCHRRCSPWTPG
jgi:CubicO group peptidase (beta-lactamase class C family)